MIRIKISAAAYAAALALVFALASPATACTGGTSDGKVITAEETCSVDQTNVKPDPTPAEKEELKRLHQWPIKWHGMTCDERGCRK